LALTRTWFDHKCNDGIECLRQYQREYDEDKKVFRDKPRHDWTSHGADAFRYLALTWKDEAKIVTAETPIRGVSVGQSNVSLNELWKDTKVQTNNRI